MKAASSTSTARKSSDASKGAYLQNDVCRPMPLAEGKAALTPMLSFASTQSRWISRTGGGGLNGTPTSASSWPIAVSKFTMRPGPMSLSDQTEAAR